MPVTSKTNKIVLGQDLKPKWYDPMMDGTDGWHTNLRYHKGAPYIWRHHLNGFILSYLPGESEFSYYEG